jgi:hypothetical protein
MMPLAWKAELHAARKFAFSARLGKLITYHVLSRSDVYPAYVEVRGLRGSLKRVDLGCYNTVNKAKWVCERHYAAGCDLSKAKKITH